jgi:hypothetical protein
MNIVSDNANHNDDGETNDVGTDDASRVSVDVEKNEESLSSRTSNEDNASDSDDKEGATFIKHVVTSSSSQSRWVKECHEKKVSTHDEEEAWMDTDSSGEFDLSPQLIEVQRIKLLQKKVRESSTISEPGAYDSVDGSVRVKNQETDPGIKEDVRGSFIPTSPVISATDQTEDDIESPQEETGLPIVATVVDESQDIEAMKQQMTQELENTKTELETEAERLRSQVLEKNRKLRTLLVYLLIVVVVKAAVVGAIFGLGNKNDNAETSDEARPYDTTPIGHPNSGTQYILGPPDCPAIRNNTDVDRQDEMPVLGFELSMEIVMEEGKELDIVELEKELQATLVTHLAGCVYVEGQLQDGKLPTPDQVGRTPVYIVANGNITATLLDGQSCERLVEVPCYSINVLMYVFLKGEEEISVLFDLILQDSTLTEGLSLSPPYRQTMLTVVTSTDPGASTTAPPVTALFPPPTASPTTPAPTTPAPTGIQREPVQEISEYRFTVESVEEGGRLFVLAAGNFPIAILPHENEDMMTALHVLNTRTNTTKAVVVQLLSETGTVRGYYNPEAFATPNDFKVGDQLEALDYKSLLPNGSCSQEEFGIVGDVDPGLGWNLPPSNIRIGKKGVIGDLYQDFEYTLYLDDSVSTLWTDAVDLEIEYSTTGESYSQLIPQADDPALRDFGRNVSGTIHIAFFDAQPGTTGSLVTHRNGGGLHIAFCR